MTDFYKEKIIEMIREMRCEKILRLIYGFVRSGYNEERAGE